LSEYAKAQTRTVLKMLGNVDSDLLEIAVTAYSDGIAHQDVGPWCRDTANRLDEGSRPPKARPGQPVF
jgi:hypothetical protein